MTHPAQPAILRPVPPAARFVTFALRDKADPTPGLRRLSDQGHDGRSVVGFGAPLLARIGAGIDGLRGFPIDLGLFPATQGSLWLALSHTDRGAAFDAGRAIAGTLGSGFTVVEEIDAFTYRRGKDLSGFEDGTENPTGKAAQKAAFIAERGRGLEGGTFVAVQRWVHDLRAMEAMSEDARNAVVGRKRKGNQEIADAPASAHVKRTNQATPESFILRRSMPYGGIKEHGLYFVAYGQSLDRFENHLRRMAGRDDGVVDGMMSFTRAVTGGYYFCPPVVRGKLDMSAVGF